MRDPFSWSIPLGRLFGISIRVHWFYPVVALGLILRVAYQKVGGVLAFPEGAWIDATILAGLTFVVILLHEFGHCFGARWVDGDSQEILMWPLGGLAFVDVPHTAKANFIATAAGPAVNLVICLAAGLLLWLVPLEPVRPIWDPLAYVLRNIKGEVELTTWAGQLQGFSPYSPAVLLAWLFYLSWFLFLFNVLLIGFPLDGGRLLQCSLWPWLGYRQATLWAVMAGFVTATLVGLYSVVQGETLALGLAIFIGLSCKQQWFILETGGEESLFGYDFSQGYTSLERDQPQPPAPRPRTSWWQRWYERRAAQKMKREQEARERDENRMDMLLEKISNQGIGALTDEERRFMKQFSDRYRNR